jgi:hypothetical protein
MVDVMFFSRHRGHDTEIEIHRQPEMTHGTSPLQKVWVVIRQNHFSRVKKGPLSVDLSDNQTQGLEAVCAEIILFFQRRRIETYSY